MGRQKPSRCDAASAFGRQCWVKERPSVSSRGSSAVCFLNKPSPGNAGSVFTSQEELAGLQKTLLRPI